MKYFYLISMWGFITSTSNGQVTFNFRSNFETPACYLTSVVANDSCYYATGIYVDTLVQVGSLFVRFDLEGEPVFVKKLISPNKSYETRRNTLISLEDGNFIVTGLTFDPVMKGMLIKYNSNGDTLWTKEYLNPFYPAFEFIHPLALARMPDEGFVLFCWIDKSQYNPDIYLIRTDSLGNKLWEKVYGTTAWDRPRSGLTTSEGNIVAGGASTNQNTVVENYVFQCHVFQTDTIGNVQWNFYTPTNVLRDAANGMEWLEDESMVVASGIGTEIDNPSVNTVWFDNFVFKLKPDHLIIDWEITFKEPELTGSAFTTNLIRLSNGSGFVVAGTTAEDTPGDGTFAIRGWLGKVSNEGDTVWTREYVGVTSNNPDHAVLDLKETPDGGFVLCGQSIDWDADSLRQQAWLLKLDSYGCLVPGCQTVPTQAPRKPEIQLAIYPNPTSDFLNFQLRSAQPLREARYRIVNTEGMLMKEFRSDRPAATFMVPVESWASGVYFLQYLEGGAVRASERFVVTK